MKIRTYADVKVLIKTEDIPKKNVIYKLTFPSGKVYIGQTTQMLKRRIQGHCRDAFKTSENCFHTTKCRAIRKHLTFSVDILYQGDDLNDQEEYFIKQYDSVNNGYNLTYSGSVSGAFSGKKHSKESIDKMRSSSYWKGKTLTDEMKEHISNSKKELYKNPEKIISNRINQKNRKEVNQYTEYGEFIKSYISIRDAERETGLNRVNIRSALDKINKNGNPALCGGFMWKTTKNN